MKRNHPLLWFGLFLLFAQLSFGQNAQKEIKKYSDGVPRTQVAQFEWAIDLSEEARDSLKQKHKARIMAITQALDTLDISEKRKQRLLSMLQKNPFSEKVLRVVATTAHE
ncbi:hypothetical protein [Allomuricauda sp. SCSIO 65647]|uniref:hypothetical protein n=1 Tax=Allomuricauda sp. SCSIO 65647 TaxID=2908843 RepID=UPI001F21FC09|nr:hypothetical protein [Muricauda sp. SCSIO 65647]UJH67391.1 hypothetical protein L0P89_15755 [Muricauda sp. SCSIO 65647]